MTQRRLTTCASCVPTLRATRVAAADVLVPAAVAAAAAAAVVEAAAAVVDVATTANAITAARTLGAPFAPSPVLCFCRAWHAGARVPR